MATGRVLFAPAGRARARAENLIRPGEQLADGSADAGNAHGPGGVRWKSDSYGAGAARSADVAAV